MHVGALDEPKAEQQRNRRTQANQRLHQAREIIVNIHATKGLLRCDTACKRGQLP